MFRDNDLFVRASGLTFLNDSSRLEIILESANDDDDVSIERNFLKIQPKKKRKNHSRHQQCNQMGRFFTLWATIQSLWQQLICPNLLHS